MRPDAFWSATPAEAAAFAAARNERRADDQERAERRVAALTVNIINHIRALAGDSSRVSVDELLADDDGDGGEPDEALEWSSVQDLLGPFAEDRRDPETVDMIREDRRKHDGDVAADVA